MPPVCCCAGPSWPCLRAEAERRAYARTARARTATAATWVRPSCRHRIGRAGVQRQRIRCGWRGRARRASCSSDARRVQRVRRRLIALLGSRMLSWSKGSTRTTPIGRANAISDSRMTGSRPNTEPAWPRMRPSAGRVRDAANVSPLPAARRAWRLPQCGPTAASVRLPPQLIIWAHALRAAVDAAHPAPGSGGQPQQNAPVLVALVEAQSEAPVAYSKPSPN